MTTDQANRAVEETLPGLRRTVEQARAEAAKARSRRAKDVEPAEVDPVARVLVDLPLAHLDRPFDYQVPASMAEAAQPGTRVKVRFAGQDVDGLLLARGADTDHAGQLRPLRRVVSPEPVLAPQIAELAEKLAARYAGTRSDVLRLAIPPRHATTEKKPPPEPAAPPAYDPAEGRAAWSGEGPAAAYLRHLERGGAPRAVWTAGPATDWPSLLAHAAATTLAGGRGAVICLPDHRDVDRVDAALTGLLGAGHHVRLMADAGPAARYREFLAISRGQVRIAVGTRSAAFAPVHDLGLAVVWDDGDDLHDEPRAPYPTTREVLRLRAGIEDAGLLIAGHACTVAAATLLAEGEAHLLAPSRARVRDRVTVRVAGATDAELARDAFARGARIPAAAHGLVREGLARGPVLVQTPRSGYAASLACERCRTPARCALCSGPLRQPGPTEPPTCGWCGTASPAWSCGTCGDRGLRAPVVGGIRTAEELGRAFPGARVSTSSGERVLARIDARPGIVVATPGAEPLVDGGYAAVLLLDTWLPLARADLRSGEEALRRWLNAAALVAPGGEVLAVGDPGHPALQALVRWDPTGFARREAAERTAARLPPAARIATLTATADDLEEALLLLDRPTGCEVLGPAPVEVPKERAVLRVPTRHGAALAQALTDLQRLRSARKLDAVRVQLDPPTL